MKKVKNISEFSGRDWEELASVLSGEIPEGVHLPASFGTENDTIIKYWKELREMNNEKEINVDKAWDKLFTRLDGNGLIDKNKPVERRLIGRGWLQAAAAILILLGIGSGVLYLGDRGILSRKTIVETSENQKNLQVTLPDGSNVILNRNTRLAYRANSVKPVRRVSLRGEAYFDITPDSENPFIVQAGKASVRVVGTTFNVISSNEESAVEVYVTTGKVMLSAGNAGQDILIEPGFVGTVNGAGSDRRVNDDPNYLSWNTGLLIYDGQTLDVVFRDLKRVYNMEIVADDPQILEKPWTAPIINQPEEKIIRLICANFALDYRKDGNVYHLSEK